LDFGVHESGITPEHVTLLMGLLNESNNNTPEREREREREVY
jgi:hypothetical protein